MTVALRRIFPSKETAARHVRWLNDPEVTRYSDQRHLFHTIESELAYLTSIKPPDLLLAITLDNYPVGSISVATNAHNQTADLGILIGNKEAWGHGIGGRAWSMAIDLVFDFGVRKIEAGCMAANTAMVRICEKTGMVEEGRRAGHFLLDDEPQDMIFFGKFNESAAAQQPIRPARYAIN